jgi:erythromycin esterase
MKAATNARSRWRRFTATILLLFGLLAQAQEVVSGEDALAKLIKRESLALRDASDLDPLMERIGDARYVLLGEASHGTSDYYTWRARLSQRLIEEKGFSFVAVEGDWPDSYRVNRYVKGEVPNRDAYDVLHAFARWPTWMWANWEVVAFTEWLKEHNEGLPEGQVGFYGLDVYSLWESLAVILDYLEENRATLQRTEALVAARAASKCFQPFDEDEKAYAQATLRVPTTCEAEAVALLTEIRRLEVEDPETRFNLLQNAFAVVNAERYYHAMVRDNALSWNVRDVHMADTLGRLLRHHGPDAKAIVWEHNTHVGDARAASMAAQGMVNLGQLVRERYGEADTVLVGFGSHHGTVIAAEAWGAPMEEMTVPPAEAESWESVFARAGEEDQLLIMDRFENPAPFSAPLGHRAIGVVYDPLLERFGNYVPTVLPERYDAFIYLHETEALHPLHMEPRSRKSPQLYPWGF